MAQVSKTSKTKSSTKASAPAPTLSPVSNPKVIAKHSHDELTSRIVSLETEIVKLAAALSLAEKKLNAVESKPLPAPVAAQSGDPRVDALIKQLRQLSAHLRGKRQPMPTFLL